MEPRDVPAADTFLDLPSLAAWADPSHAEAVAFVRSMPDEAAASGAAAHYVAWIWLGRPQSAGILAGAGLREASL